MNRRSLARLVTTVGVAAAVAIGTAGPAGAQPPPGADDQGMVDEREQQAGPHASAPTANLRTLANAIVVKHKGIYLDITAPPGLGVGPVEISIGFGFERFTRNYDNTTGFDRILAFQPLDGAPRLEYVNISLLERGGPGGPFHYAISSQVNVVPQYTVTTSALRFATGGCDLLNGEADPDFYFVDADGVQREESDSGDEAVVSGFARTFTDVDVSRGLTMPRMVWIDRDPGGSNLVVSGVPRGPELLPFPVSYRDRNPVVQEITDTLPEGNGDCSAVIRYTITYTPTAYTP